MQLASDTRAIEVAYRLSAATTRLLSMVTELQSTMGIAVEDIVPVVPTELPPLPAGAPMPLAA